MKTTTQAILTLIASSVIGYSTIGHADPAKSSPSASASVTLPAATPADSIAALVNGTPIMMSTLDHEIKRQPMLSYQLSQVGSDPAKIRQVKINALNALVEREVLLKKASEDPKLSPKEIDEARSAFISANYGNEKELEKLLPSMGTNLEEFKRELGNDFLIRAYLASLLPASKTPTDAELKKIYDANPAKYAQKESVHARHILIKLSETPTPAEIAAAEEKIKSIRSEISSGTIDFADAAKKYSACPSASRGGDLGTFPKGAMVPPFEQVAFSSKVGETSEPVRTEFGYHLIKVEEHIEAAPPSFEAAKPILLKEYELRQRQEFVKNKIEEIKKSAKIEIKF